MDLGIVGINSRAAAASAGRAGHRVFLVDYFQDLDTQAYVHFPMQKRLMEPDPREEYSPEKMVEYAIEKLEGLTEHLLVTSELGCSPENLRKLGKRFTLLGNTHKEVGKAKSWRKIRKALDRLGIEYPRTIPVETYRELVSAVRKIDYPAMVKGVGSPATIIREGEDLLGYKEGHPEELWVQEHIPGEAVSASVLSDGGTACCLSLNQQLIGLREFRAQENTYCGNVVPLKRDMGLEKISEALVEELGLLGSNGVDYLIEGGRIVFMEVNTRLQDTLENVEKYLGINLVEEHLKALEGTLPQRKKGRGCYGKAILYAGEDMMVGDIVSLPYTGDIPLPGSRIKAYDPVCSVYAEGKDVLGELKDRAKKVFFSC